MSIKAAFVHTNLIADDWRALAQFYERVFGCVRIPPERDYRGPLLEAGTAVPGAELQGVHLRLPGYDANGPTLEIFHYSRLEPRARTVVNRPGFGHIAFSVEDVASAREVVLGNGGGTVGEIVTLRTATGDTVTWTYVTDPEGNVIELQSWSKGR
jgi:predicted enzyme related to lactoylglutathione lyase